MMRYDGILDSREAANLLRLHEETLRRLTREGKVPAFRVGRRWRYDRRVLDAWMLAQQTSVGQRAVLVVDDQEDVRKVVRVIVEKDGFRLMEAAGGREALNIMRLDPPDVVLLDLEMPGMDGPTTLSEIRGAHGDMPVVIITGHPDGSLLARALEHGPLMVLAKPIGAQCLLSSIKTAMNSDVGGTPR